VLGYYLDAYPVNLMSTGSGPNSAYDLWRCAVTNHDYFISKRAFFFDLAPWSDEAASDEPSQKPGTDLETMRLLMAAMVKRNGKSCLKAVRSVSQ
jgi:2-oxo-4-hydroxy-4-carboxy--5-ureidoimidazoline (OHCU) decarboxylase